MHIQKLVVLHIQNMVFGSKFILVSENGIHYDVQNAIFVITSRREFFVIVFRSTATFSFILWTIPSNQFVPRYQTLYRDKMLV